MGTEPDRMTPSERLKSIAAGKRPDRVPMIPFVKGYAARLCGFSLKNFYTDMEICVKAQVLAQELHGYDQQPSFGWADWGGWEFGGQVRFPESDLEGAPRTLRHPVERPSDLERLEVPDPQSAGWYPLLTDFNRIITKLGFRAKIVGGSVTNVVAGMIGVEKLFRWYFREPEAVRLAYAKATELILKGADMVVREFGPNCSVSYGAPLESNEMMSPAIFEKFSWPHLDRIHRWLIDRGVTQLTVHLCGDHRANLEAWASLPLPRRTVISIGSKVGLREAADAFGPDHVIAGNVSTTTLAFGGYEEVLTEARRCIQTGKDLPGGYILMPACEMPVFTPPINVHALLAAARMYGAYD